MTRTDRLSASGLTADEVGVILDVVAAAAESVRLAFPWRPAVRDPDDDMVLETAANGRTDAIVTFNKRDVATVAERFGVRALSPGEALKLLEIRPSERAISRFGFGRRCWTRRASSPRPKAWR